MEHARGRSRRTPAHTYLPSGRSCSRRPGVARCASSWTRRRRLSSWLRFRGRWTGARVAPGREALATSSLEAAGDGGWRLLWLERDSLCPDQRLGAPAYVGWCRARGWTPTAVLPVGVRLDRVSRLGHVAVLRLEDTEAVSLKASTNQTPAWVDEHIHTWSAAVCARCAAGGFERGSRPDGEKGERSQEELCLGTEPTAHRARAAQLLHTPSLIQPIRAVPTSVPLAWISTLSRPTLAHPAGTNWHGWPAGIHPQRSSPMGQ